MFRSHVLKELSAYLDDQLSERMKEKVEKHLADCNNCREELSRLKQLSEQLKAWQTPDLGADFDARVRHQIVLGELEKGEVKMERKLTSKWIPSSALVVVLLMAVLTGQFYVKRGWEGKLKSAADDVGEQVEPAKYSANLELKSSSAVRSLQGHVRNSADAGQYEPYYVHSKVGSDRIAEWSGSADATRNMLAAGSDAYEAGDQPADSGEGSVIVVYPVLPATAQGEKVIRDAKIMLEVVDGRAAYNKASAICQELGGYLSSSKFYKDSEGREAGTIIMRIPKDKFGAAQEKLSTLGKVEDITTDSKDVTQEYNSLKIQLDTVKVIYDKMLEAFKKRQVTIPDAIRQESELAPIRSKMENLSNRIAQLDNSISFTTITLGFHEPKVSEKTLSESRNIIKEGMITAKINFIKFMAGAIPTAILTAVWVIIGLVVLLLVKPLISSFFKK
jgi:anti-sigma factor RsiW